jgi:hypothetical protein
MFDQTQGKAQKSEAQEWSNTSALGPGTQITGYVCVMTQTQSDHLTLTRDTAKWGNVHLGPQTSGARPSDEGQTNRFRHRHDKRKATCGYKNNWHTRAPLSCLYNLKKCRCGRDSKGKKKGNHCHLSHRKSKTEYKSNSSNHNKFTV